jgi:hypothetical protein
VKKIEYSLRSACALAIILCFVVFFTASAPHRVHHLFENLQYPSQVFQEQARTLSLTASSQTVLAGDQAPTSRDHDHLANGGKHRHNHGRHHSHSRGNNHKHDHGGVQPKPQVVNYAQSHEHSSFPDGPLHANTPNDDAHHDNSAQTVCLLQSAAQHSHLSAAQLVGISFLGIESQERADSSFLGLSTFNASPFSQRAPPKV